MKDRYQFVALFNKEESGYNLWFPDLEEAYTCVDSFDDLFVSAKEVLELTLYGRIRDDEEIPEPTSIENLTIQEGEAPILIEVNMKVLKEKMENRSVKKTLSIPAWLNTSAEEAGINFSQTLQEALKNKLAL